MHALVSSRPRPRHRHRLRPRHPAPPALVLVVLVLVVPALVLVLTLVLVVLVLAFALALWLGASISSSCRTFASARFLADVERAELHAPAKMHASAGEMACSTTSGEMACSTTYRWAYRSGEMARSRGLRGLLLGDVRLGHCLHLQAVRKRRAHIGPPVTGRPSCHRAACANSPRPSCHRKVKQKHGGTPQGPPVTGRLKTPLPTPAQTGRGARAQPPINQVHLRR